MFIVQLLYNDTCTMRHVWCTHMYEQYKHHTRHMYCTYICTVQAPHTVHVLYIHMYSTSTTHGTCTVHTYVRMYSRNTTQDTCDVHTYVQYKHHTQHMYCMYICTVQAPHTAHVLYVHMYSTPYSSASPTCSIARSRCGPQLHHVL